MRRQNYRSYPELKRRINEIRRKVDKKAAEETAKFVNALLACGFTDKDICFNWDGCKFLHVSLCEKEDT